MHLGKVTTTKCLFGKKAAGSERFAKSKSDCFLVQVNLEVVLCEPTHLVLQVLSLIQRVVVESKCVTQRDAYYTLIQHFRNQAEFNDTLQGLYHHPHISVYIVQ